MSDRVACPYVGLYPFTAKHARFFFGREKDIRVISYNVSGTRLTILYGASGVGKSSVLQAGVVPELRTRPGTAVVYFRSWHGDFTGDLRRACCEALGATGATGSLYELLREHAVSPKPRLLLMLDQFEEYLSQHPEQSSETGFDADLARIVNDEELRVNVLLGLREDALWTLDHRLQPRIAGLLENTLRLSHLDEAGARMAMTGPLEEYAKDPDPQGPTAIEPELVETVVKEALQTRTEAGQVETPYLQLILTKLWLAEGKGSPKMRLDTLNSPAVGGAKNIVYNHLMGVLNGLSKPERELCVRIFPHMVTPTGAKIPLSVDDLKEHAEVRGDSRALEALLVKLADEKQQDETSQARILRRIDRPRRYEIFHDVLGKAIQTWNIGYESARRTRRRAGWVAASLVVAAIAAGGGFSLFQWRQTEAARSQSELNAQEARLRAATAEEQLAQLRARADPLVKPPEVQAGSAVAALLANARKLESEGKSEEAAKQLIAASLAGPDLEAKQFISASLGRLNSGKQGAVESYSDAYQVAVQRNDTQGQYDLLLALARETGRLPDSKLTIGFLTKASALKVKEPVMQADALSQLGVAQEKSGDLKAAAQSYSRALALYEGVQAKVQVKATLVQLGSVYNKLGDGGKAREYFDRAEGKTASASTAVIEPLPDVQPAAQKVEIPRAAEDAAQLGLMQASFDRLKGSSDLTELRRFVEEYAKTPGAAIQVQAIKARITELEEAASPGPAADRLKASINPAELQAFVTRFERVSGAEAHVQAIKARIEELEKQLRIAPGTTRSHSDGLRYVWIPPGKFKMGCSPGDPQCYGGEKPVHEVTVSSGFWLGQTEVTQRAWEKAMKSKPSRFSDDDRPVETVNWEQAAGYCRTIGGRLPTEAEWEYAARAGSTAATYGPLDKIAWYARNAKKPEEVAKAIPNSWGLYDMLGNVWEWTADWYGPYSDKAVTDPRGPSTGERRVLRGGSWNSTPGGVRVSYRSGFVPTFRDFVIGFRCAGEFR